MRDHGRKEGSAGAVQPSTSTQSRDSLPRGLVGALADANDESQNDGSGETGDEQQSNKAGSFPSIARPQRRHGEEHDEAGEGAEEQSNERADQTLHESAAKRELTLDALPCRGS